MQAKNAYVEDGKLRKVRLATAYRGPQQEVGEKSGFSSTVHENAESIFFWPLLALVSVLTELRSPVAHSLFASDLDAAISRCARRIW